MHNLVTFVLPVFEGIITSSTTNSAIAMLEHPRSPNEYLREQNSQQSRGSEANAGGGGLTSSIDAAAAIIATDGSLAGSLASDPTGITADLPPGAASGIVLETGEQTANLSRVLELETTVASPAERDVEAAEGILPEPAVPAPDPKLLAIPFDKVRQLVRRPLPRMQRTPLQKLEILPPPSSQSPSPSRPSSSAAHAAKAKEDVGPKGRQAGGGDGVEEQEGSHMARGKDEERERAGALSGALEGNPYRWVVRSNNDGDGCSNNKTLGN